MIPTHLGPVAFVEFSIPNNAWWQDALQFGDPTDTSWSFTNVTLLMDIKVNATDSVPLMALSSANADMVIDDAVLRIMHMTISDTRIRANLPVTSCTSNPTVGPYVYDLIMVDNNNGGARTLLMQGKIEVEQGVTIED